MGENPDVKVKNIPTTIATCEKTVAISKRREIVPLIFDFFLLHFHCYLFTTQTHILLRVLEHPFCPHEIGPDKCVSTKISKRSSLSNHSSRVSVKNDRAYAPVIGYCRKTELTILHEVEGAHRKTFWRVLFDRWRD